MYASIRVCTFISRRATGSADSTVIALPALPPIHKHLNPVGTPSFGLPTSIPVVGRYPKRTWASAMSPDATFFFATSSIKLNHESRAESTPSTEVPPSGPRSTSMAASFCSLRISACLSQMVLNRLLFLISFRYLSAALAIAFQILPMMLRSSRVDNRFGSAPPRAVRISGNNMSASAWALTNFCATASGARNLFFKNSACWARVFRLKFFSTAFALPAESRAIALFASSMYWCPRLATSCILE